MNGETRVGSLTEFTDNNFRRLPWCNFRFDAKKFIILLRESNG